MFSMAVRQWRKTRICSYANASAGCLFTAIVLIGLQDDRLGLQVFNIYIRQSVRPRIINVNVLPH